MKPSFLSTKTLFCLLILLGILGLLSFAAVSEKSREYDITVPEYKSDTVRMIEAYERLSDQYLTLVQRHLLGMDSTDQAILRKLESLEKKLDEVSQKIDRLTPAVPAQQP